MCVWVGGVEMKGNGNERVAQIPLIIDKIKAIESPPKCRLVCVERGDRINHHPSADWCVWKEAIESITTQVPTGVWITHRVRAPHASCAHSSLVATEAHTPSTHSHTRRTHTLTQVATNCGYTNVVRIGRLKIPAR